MTFFWEFDYCSLYFSLYSYWGEGLLSFLDLWSYNLFIKLGKHFVIYSNTPPLNSSYTYISLLDSLILSCDSPISFLFPLLLSPSPCPVSPPPLPSLSPFFYQHLTQFLWNFLLQYLIYYWSYPVIFPFQILFLSTRSSFLWGFFLCLLFLYLTMFSSKSLDIFIVAV